MFHILDSYAVKWAHFLAVDLDLAFLVRCFPPGGWWFSRLDFLLPFFDTCRFFLLELAFIGFGWFFCYTSNPSNINIMTFASFLVINLYKELIGLERRWHDSRRHQENIE